MVFTISNVTLRRFILGKQGLYPGRRWQGKNGIMQALSEGCIVQVDPLNVVARSHDIVLYGRMIDYHPSQLDSLLYKDRVLFDYGGTVMIQPMDELPYFRVVMARKCLEARRIQFANTYQKVIDAVLSEIRERGALGARDFGGDTIKQGSFRSSKVTGQALYYLWIAGELMTHSRQGFNRIYDLRERMAPPSLQHSATPDEAEDYFARKVLQEIGITTERGWRGWWAGAIERKVEPSEGKTRLDELIQSNVIVPILLEGDTKTPRYILAQDLPLLESLQQGKVPDIWQPIETTNDDEVIFLAPLEIVSTRGRALPLFGFEYLWEVYKPEAKRRWGYYTLPILYRDQLVARLDPKLERASGTLVIKGFWLESATTLDEAFISALISGFRRFTAFIGAKHVDFSAVQSPSLRQALEAS
jgi:uncharacterized protein